MFIILVDKQIVDATTKAYDDSKELFDEAVAEYPKQEVHLIWVDGHRSEVRAYHKGRECSREYCKYKATFRVYTFPVPHSEEMYSCNTCLPKMVEPLNDVRVVTV